MKPRATSAIASRPIAMEPLTDNDPFSAKKAATWEGSRLFQAAVYRRAKSRTFAAFTKRSPEVQAVANKLSISAVNCGEYSERT